jgi:hypothetical protein
MTSTGKLTLKFKPTSALHPANIENEALKKENEALKESCGVKRKNLDAFKKIVEDQTKEIEKLNLENLVLRAKLSETQEHHEMVVADLKDRLADETTPAHRGWWENRVGELTLQNWNLEKRNDFIIELLTEKQLGELKARDEEEAKDDEEDDESVCSHCPSDMSEDCGCEHCKECGGCRQCAECLCENDITIVNGEYRSTPK